MLPRTHPDRIQIAFDDHRLVANAGLLLPATLAHHLGLSQLVQERLNLGNAPGRVSRELLARAWAAGAGPGDGPLTINLDSTICETYGLAKEGARHHGYTGKRGYHPLLAIAAVTGDVLMSRLREGRANTARGAAHFLRETVGRVRYGGASGQLTVRTDSGFYTHGVVSVCRKLNVRFSITIRQHARLRNLIEAIPEADWTPIPYWMDGAVDVAETTYSFHGFITDRDGDTLELEADHRRHAEVENAIRDLKYGVGLNHLPSGRFAANGAWLAIQSLPRTRYGVMAHNLARWTARIALGEQMATTKTLRRRFFSLAWTDHPLGPPSHPASATELAVAGEVRPRPGPAPSHSAPSLTALVCHRPAQRTTEAPANSCHHGPTAPPSVSSVLILPPRAHRRPPSVPPKRLQAARRPPTYPNQARIVAPVTPSHPSAVLTPSTSMNRWIRV